MLKRIKEDQLNARKEHNKLKTGMLTALLGEISIVGKNNGNRETTDAEAIVVIKKFLKNVNETLKIFTRGSMEMGAGSHTVEKINELRAEIKIYESYLPKQLSEDELKDIISRFGEEAYTSNVGTVMKYLKENYNGLYDGKLASTIAKEFL